MTPFNNNIKEQLAKNLVNTVRICDSRIEGVEKTTLPNAIFVTLESSLFYEKIDFTLQAFTATATDRELTVEEVTEVIYQGEQKTCYTATAYSEKDISALGFPEQLKELVEKLFSPIAETAVTETTYVSNANDEIEALCIIAKQKDGSVVGMRVSYRSE